MANILLLIGIIILEALAIVFFKDILSPPCIVCASFLLAYACACLSSSIDGWRFEISYTTTLLIIIGLLLFLIGSILGYKIKKSCTQQKTNSSLKFIYIENKKIYIILVTQLLLLAIYIYFYKKSVAQFGGLSWTGMIRAYRFISSYGDGLEIPIPGWVNQVVKISRANAYIALYVLMHNLAIHKFLKKKMPQLLQLILVILLYIPYNLMNAARFELMVLISMGLVVWYSYYRYCSIIHGKKKRNMKKAVIKILTTIIIAFIIFSTIAPLVGRLESESIISQGVNYFGRSIQAFDTYVNNPTYNTEWIKKESIYNVIKLLCQLNILKGDPGKIHLEFEYQNGYSLGNTYTAFRRYYADWGIWGIVFFSLMCGFCLTRLYKKTQKTSIGNINFQMVIYSAIIFSAFLYCFDDYLFAAIVSVNYLIIFLTLFGVTKWVKGENIFTTKKHNKNVLDTTLSVMEK